jgi:hypothetical protein
MRNLLTAGALAIALGLGASTAYALPPNSPYAIWVPESVDQPATSNGSFAGRAATDPSFFQALAPRTTEEGRAAFVSGDAVSSGSQIVTPEDQTYYSRGR